MKTTALTLLAALLTAGCHEAKKAGDESPAPKVAGEKIILPDNSPHIAALATEAAEASHVPVVRLTGRMVWDDDVTVRVFSPFAGRVTGIAVQSGQAVQPGDTLALIASPDYGQAQADTRKAASDFLQAERSLNRVKELYEHGAAPLKDFQSAQADYERAQSEKQRSEERMKMYGGGLKTTDQSYALRSPLGGFVVEKNITPGQEVRPDQMLANAPQFFSPLFVVTDPSRLWVLLDATEQDLPNLKPGQPIVIRARAYPGQEFKGKIDVISDALDPATRTVRVRGSTENVSRLLKGEMLVTVDLASLQPVGISIPSKAVFLKGEKHYVFLQEAPGQFTRRQIKIGPERDGKIPVLEGIQPGERVVCENSLLLEQMMNSAGG